MTTDKTAFICAVCRECNRQRTTHPGAMHAAGICDCPCRDPQPRRPGRDA